MLYLDSEGLTAFIPTENSTTLHTFKDYAMTVAKTFGSRSPWQKRTWRYSGPSSAPVPAQKVRMLPQGYGIWLKPQQDLIFGERERFAPTFKRGVS
jgi:hypothetical protein